MTARSVLATDNHTILIHNPNELVIILNNPILQLNKKDQPQPIALSPTMSLPIDKLFLIIALIAMPNLYYRAQYNVPLLLFCFAMWQSQSQRGTLVLLLIFSWLIDIYCIIRTIAGSQGQSTAKPRIVLILQIVVFVLKVIMVVMVVCVDRATREAISPENLCKNVNKIIHSQGKDREPVLQN